MEYTDQSEEQYQRLFNEHHQAVYAYCRRRADAQTAADCVAETFLVLWRRLDTVPAGDKTLGWLYAVARKTLANEFRRSKRQQRLLDRLRQVPSTANPGAEAVVVQREQDRTMLAALEQLRSRDRELLRLAWWEELPHAQIAEVLGCSTDAVNHRIHRAARRAAKEFHRLDHGRVDSPGRLRGGVT